MSYFGMFCRITCNRLFNMYNNYLNVQELALPPIFRGFEINQKFWKEDDAYV